MNYTTFYLLLCIIFAGRGDERWKKRTRDDEHKDIKESDASAGMERDLWPYEYDFDVDTEKVFYNVKRLKSLKSQSRHRMYRTKPEETEKNSILDNFLSNALYSNRVKNITNGVSIDINRLKKDKNLSKEITSTTPKWPKFEELLLSIGVEYDWKSDRWLKLKEKVRINDKTVESFNTEGTRQKHEFKYRTIRINGSKRKKNIIIALTAIR